MGKWTVWVVVVLFATLASADTEELTVSSDVSESD